MFLPVTYVSVRGGKATHLMEHGQTVPLCGQKGDWQEGRLRKPIHADCRRRAGVFLPLNPRMTDEEVRRDDAAGDL